VAGLAAGGFNRNLDLARLPPRSDLREEFGGFALGLAGQSLGLAG